MPEWAAPRRSGGGVSDGRSPHREKFPLKQSPSPSAPGPRPSMHCICARPPATPRRRAPVRAESVAIVISPQSIPDSHPPPPSALPHWFSFRWDAMIGPSPRKHYDLFTVLWHRSCRVRQSGGASSASTRIELAARSAPWRLCPVHRLHLKAQQVLGLNIIWTRSNLDKASCSSFKAAVLDCEFPLANPTVLNLFSTVSSHWET